MKVEINKGIISSNYSHYKNGVKKQKARKLSTKWCVDTDDDLHAMHGIDVDNEMINIMSEELKREIDQEILNSMKPQYHKNGVLKSIV